MVFLAIVDRQLGLIGAGDGVALGRFASGLRPLGSLGTDPLLVQNSPASAPIGRIAENFGGLRRDGQSQRSRRRFKPRADFEGFSTQGGH